MARANESVVEKCRGDAHENSAARRRPPSRASLPRDVGPIRVVPSSASSPRPPPRSSSSVLLFVLFLRSSSFLFLDSSHRVQASRVVGVLLSVPSVLPVPPSAIASAAAGVERVTYPRARLAARVRETDSAHGELVVAPAAARCRRQYVSVPVDRMAVALARSSEPAARPGSVSLIGWFSARASIMAGSKKIAVRST